MLQRKFDATAKSLKNGAKTGDSPVWKHLHVLKSWGQRTFDAGVKFYEKAIS